MLIKVYSNHYLRVLGGITMLGRHFRKKYIKKNILKSSKLNFDLKADTF